MRPILLVLFHVAAARYMLTANFLTADGCDQMPPDVMYGWNLLLENSTRAPASYAWPETYSRQASFRTYSVRCYGTLKAELSKECCVTSLNVTRSGNYTSYTTILADPENPLVSAPKSSLGATYCHLRAVRYTPSSAFGFDHAYYHANGQCISPHRVICNKDKTLSVFPTVGCQGTPTVISLNSTATVFNLTRLGLVTGDFVEVTQATSEFSWTILDRSPEYVPKFQYASDYAQVLLFITCVILLSYSIYQHSLKAWKAKRLYPIGEVAAQFFWLVFVVLRFVGQVGFWNYFLDGSTYLFHMAASLGSIAMSLNFFFIMHSSYRRFYWPAMLLLLLVHGGLTFTQYTRFRIVPTPASMFSPANNAIWAINLQIWFLLMYFGNCIPPLKVLHMIVSRYEGTIQEKLSQLWNINRKIFIVVISQVLIAIWFVLQQNIREASEILGHDRVWLCFLQVESLTHVLHSICTLFLVTNMVDVVNKSGPGKSSIQPSKASVFSTKAQSALVTDS
jgi:hypothetical protein